MVLLFFLWERRVDSGFKLKRGVEGVIFRRLLGLRSLASEAETTLEALIFLSRWCCSVLFCCILGFLSTKYIEKKGDKSFLFQRNRWQPAILFQRSKWAAKRNI